MCLLLALLSLAPWVQADQLADLAYGADGNSRKTLDLYIPNEPGNHPVVVYVPGDYWRRADKRAIGNRALTFNALGQAVAAIDYRQQPEVDWRDQIADVAEAIIWVRNKGREAGGDPDHLVLFGEGSGAHLVTMLLARGEEFGLSASDLAAVQGVMIGRPQGLDLDPSLGDASNRSLWPAAMRNATDWMEQSPMQLWSTGQWPVLLWHDAASKSDGQRFAARLKERGAAVTETALAGDETPADLEQNIGAAWLKSLALGRIQRYETLNHAPSFRTGNLGLSEGDWHADKASHLFGFNGVLFAALDGNVIRTGPTRMVRLDRPAARWRQELEFPILIRSIDWLGSIQVGNDTLLAAATRHQDNGTGLWVRAPSGTWSELNVPWALSQAFVRSVISDSGVTLVMAEGRTGGVWQLTGNTAATLKVSENPEIHIDGTVAGLVRIGGQIHGAWKELNYAGQVYRRHVTGNSVEWLPQAKTDPLTSGRPVSLGVIQDTDGQDALLIAHAGAGRITRWRPGSLLAPEVEFEIEPALRQLWNDNGGDLTVSAAGFRSGLHPETNERVAMLGIGRTRTGSAGGAPFDGAHVVIRQAGGHYSIGSVHDFDSASWPKNATASYTASPFVEDQGKRWYFSGEGTPERSDAAWVETGVLDLAGPKRGPWWDRSRSGHGFDLQRIGDQWAFLFYSFDADGSPVWWSALGGITNDRFTTNANGLMLTEQVLRDGQWVSQVNTQRSGSLTVDFGLTRNEGVCNDGTDRASALALAEVSINLPGRAPIRWCLEPMQVRPGGNGQVDNNGIWTAGLLDMGWGMSLIAQGVAAANTQGAIVYYYDAAGQPRWALGSGAQQDGRATMQMLNVRNNCPECVQAQQQYQNIGQLDVTSTGACGEVATRATLDLRYPDQAGSVFTRGNVTLQRLNDASCY